MSDITDERVATALERIADALERIPAVTVGEFTLDGCDDRSCTDRDHWAPTGRINHGSTPTTCIHGQDHPDDLECEYACPATVPGHRCTRLEHAEGGHLWAMSDEEAQRILRAGQELGFVAEADPLDESDHRPRHLDGELWDGYHLTWYSDSHWHTEGTKCDGEHWPGVPTTLNYWADAAGPVTFCDCDDTTIEAP